MSEYYHYPMTLARISITIPHDLVAAADQRAEQLQRSRSWLLVEALRSYLRATEARAVHESARVPYGSAEAEARAGAPEIAAARRRRLRAELQLSPAARLERAEELVRLAEEANPRPPRAQVVGFESYEDFYAWKTSRLIRA